jgi:hypothetical protein
MEEGDRRGEDQAGELSNAYSFVVIAGLDPAIHHFRMKMDAWVKAAHDGEYQ